MLLYITGFFLALVIMSVLVGFHITQDKFEKSPDILDVLFFSFLSWITVVLFVVAFTMFYFKEKGKKNDEPKNDAEESDVQKEKK